MKYFCEFLRNTRLHETRAFFGLWCTISQKSHLQSLHTLDQALLRISAQHTIACNTHCMQQWSSRYNFSKDPSIVILYSTSSPFANLCAKRTCMRSTCLSWSWCTISQNSHVQPLYTVQGLLLRNYPLHTTIVVFEMESIKRPVYNYFI